MGDASSFVEFESIINSKLFTFIVGKDEKAFTVHSAAISKLSSTLDALINGSMEEALKNIAILSDINSDDFTRFLQFAYTGDYTPPTAMMTSEEEASSYPPGEVPVEPGEEVPAEMAPDDEPVYINDLPSVSRFHHMKKGKKKKVYETWGTPDGDVMSSSNSIRKENLRSVFNQRVYCPKTPRMLYLKTCEPVKNSQAREDFSQIFLAHARLYLFADRYGISELARLSLHKLHQTLKGFTLYPARIGDVVTLVQEVYDHTAEREDGEDLRDLVISYVASEIDAIGKSPAFTALLVDGGDLVKDVWGMVQRSLLD
ncbi:hypothetical protein MBLNU459_g3370t1 [Dothideomycetes sp. NU459]